eukprot:3971323-Lingulodinium_polyedra.AAC.1
MPGSSTPGHPPFRSCRSRQLTGPFQRAPRQVLACGDFGLSLRPPGTLDYRRPRRAAVAATP